MNACISQNKGNDILKILEQDIDWGLAKSYILREGIYMYGGINEHSEISDTLYLITIENSKISSI